MKYTEIDLNTQVWCTGFELSRNRKSIVRNAPPFLGHFEGDTYSGYKHKFVPDNCSHQIADWAFICYEFFLTYEEAAEYYNKCLAKAQKDIAHEMAVTIDKLENISKRINEMYVINTSGDCT